MKNYYYLSLFLLATIPLFWSYSSGPGGLNQAVSGAPNESTCVGCHSSNALNSGTGGFTIEVGQAITQYTPGQSYTVTVVGTGSTNQKYGFQVAALQTSDNSNAGTFTAGTGTAVRTIGVRNYLEHNTPSTTGTWTFTWQAPASDVGEVKFYLAGNAAGSPTGTAGDHIYTQELALTALTTNVEQLSKQVNRIYPNPAGASASVEVTLEASDVVAASIVDIEGRTVQTLFDGQALSAGSHTFNFDLAELKVGYYHFQLQGANTAIHLPFVKQ